jgi:hypothetical protein
MPRLLFGISYIYIHGQKQNLDFFSKNTIESIDLVAVFAVPPTKLTLEASVVDPVEFVCVCKYACVCVCVCVCVCLSNTQREGHPSTH